MAVVQRDVEHIFESLRSGTVPERGVEAFAVGIAGPREELARLLRMTASGEGGFKFLRGGYGCGKTFMARLALADAQAQQFATSFVVVSDNDLKFHRFDELYRKVVQGLSTPTCPTGALGDVLDRWVGRVEEALIAGGADADADDFDARVQERLRQDMTSRTQGQVPEEMVRALARIFELKQAMKLVEAGSLIGWLEGSTQVAARAKADAGIKGDIDSDQAMRYLRGVLEIVKAAGYKGLVIVVDELETVMRIRTDVRDKVLNGLRQIIDEASRLKGLLWVFTGTPDFFESPQGVKRLPPLYDRIKLERIGNMTSLRGPQLELTPFDEGRLREVTLKLRQLYPARDRADLERRAAPALIEGLIQSYVAGFRGQVGAVPRQFLRRYVTILDLIDEHPDFDPATALGFDRASLVSPTKQEQVLMGDATFSGDDFALVER